MTNAIFMVILWEENHLKKYNLFYLVVVSYKVVLYLVQNFFEKTFSLYPLTTF